MARSLHNKSNTVAPDSDYPYGRIRDKIAGLQSGTPVNETVYGDFHQFFSRLMAEVGIEENGQPDNAYTGFQLHQALLKTIRKIFGTYATAEDILGQSSSDMNAYIYPGVFNFDAYNASNDPSGFEGGGQLFVSGDLDSVIRQRLVDFTSGAEWVRNYTAISQVFSNWQLIRLGQKTIPFYWDMNNSSTEIVTLPFTYSKLKSVTAIIFDDSGNSALSFLAPGSLGVPVAPQTGIEISNIVVPSNTVTLHRLNGGLFDSSNYESLTVKRGDLIVEYEP